MDLQDPFTGVWIFSAAASRLVGPLPRAWRQTIMASPDAVRVDEHIEFPGLTLDVHIDARFDGAEYAVTGSPVGDTVAYTRIDPSRIAGTVKKNSRVSLTEILQVSPDGQVLTATYVVGQPDGGATSVAVFVRSSAARRDAAAPV